jgi:serine/threonine-protein kinase
VLSARYRNIRLIGTGGMGHVLRAWDSEHGGEVALKVPLEAYTDQLEFRRRFLREVEALRKLSHPNVVKLIDSHTSSDFLYYSMELVTGESLRDRLDREGALGEATTLRLLRPIAAALSASHELRIVHRDLKPANILIDAHETSYLTDFGVAVDLQRTRMTQAAAMLGTPDYMAPEQLQGEDPGPVLDVYAYGVTFFECLTGQKPFPSGQTLLRLAHEAPSVRSVRSGTSRETAELVDSCLARDRFQRPADGQELHRRLERLAAGGTAH